MVSAAKKAATIPMPMKACGFMPAGDLVASKNPASEIRRSRKLALQRDHALNLRSQLRSGLLDRASVLHYQSD
jgi:hypothetical protein